MVRFASWVLPASAWTAAATILLIGAASVSCSNGAEIVYENEAAADQLGTAGLQLGLSSGLVFRQVNLALKYPDGKTATQTIDVSADDATVSAFLGELPVGAGYELTLSTTSTTGVPCSGTAGFQIKPREAVVVMVTLQCGGGTANPDVGAARVKGEIIPNEGECPAVIDRVVVSPARAGIGVPVTVEVVPLPGATPNVSFQADDGTISGMGTRATFRCTSKGDVTISVEATRAGCLHQAEASVKCFDDGTPYVTPPGGGGGGGNGNGGNGNGNNGNGGNGNGNNGNGGNGNGNGGNGNGGAANTCQTCTANNCAAQVASCQSEPTAAACQENRTCTNVGGNPNCAASNSLACYCGNVPTATCLASGGTGVCADVITRTSGCLDGRSPGEVPLCISEHYLDIAYGLGDAYQLVACQRRNCPTQCGLTR